VGCICKPEKAQKKGKKHVKLAFFAGFFLMACARGNPEFGSIFP